MSKIVKARAWCNNEVAYLVWKTDGRIDGCLGFMITRIHLNTGERRNLPTWVAFDSQSNPKWEPQDTSVWPVQKFSWRDLTLRRSRDQLLVRDPAFKVKYEIVPVGLKAPGRQPVPASPTAQPGKYKGSSIPLYFCGDPVETNEILVTNDFGDLSIAFTNGILSTQNLRKQLKTPAGKAPTKAQVDAHIQAAGDRIREFLAGDVLPALESMFSRAEQEDGLLYLALYELHDRQLINLLVRHQKRVHLILSTAGASKPKKGSGEKPKWDITNADARKTLRNLMGTRLQNRMFNNSAHIGHNKFAVLVVGAKPVAVWTGSTNWTSTGLCAQTNNTITIESDVVAKIYFDYWTRLHADKQQDTPLTGPNSNDQGLSLRRANMASENISVDHGKTKIDVWFSPNTEKTGTANSRTVPPDLVEVFSFMKQARDAIFFLVFNPGHSDPEGEDVNTVVSAGIEFGRLDPKLAVCGAISDPKALPGYIPPPRDKHSKNQPKLPPAAIFSPPGARNVLMIRAAAINDLAGDFQKELLSAGHAIIHDKIVVIDPLSETDCAVITGSHNLGFKASYANDENLLIIRGNRPVALAYAVHVLDVYDHYKFRAILEQQVREAMLKGKPRPSEATGKGFLQANDRWQDPYLTGAKGRDLAYFLR